MNRGTKVAQGFFNFVRDLTIEIGANNANASGLWYYSNNGGSVRNIHVKSEAGNGRVGVDFSGHENGPFLAANIRVDGFDTGIFTNHIVNSHTLDTIELNNQGAVGIQNGGATSRQSLAIRNLRTYGQVPAFRSVSSNVNLSQVLVNANLVGVGGASNATAIELSGISYLRGITTSGFARAYSITHAGRTQTSGNGNNLEVSGGNGFESTSGSRGSLNIPVLNAPEVSWGDPRSWVNANLSGSGDMTARLQAAINTPGAQTVFINPGSWQVDGTLVMGGNSSVVRLISLGGTLTGNGTIRIDNSNGNAPVIIERLIGSSQGKMRVLHNSSRDLVMRDIGIQFYSNTANANGRVWMDSVLVNQMSITRQTVYARQINAEPFHNTVDQFGIGAYIVNDGGVLSLLGYKTEGRGATTGPAWTLLETKGRGMTELLGGFNYYNAGVWADGAPAYKVGPEASMGFAITGQFTSRGAVTTPKLFIQDTKGGRTLNRGYGSFGSGYFITRSGSNPVLPDPPITPVDPVTPPTTTTGSVSGMIWLDSNYNTRRDAGEAGVAGRTVYVDSNVNNRLDAGERSVVTNASGAYRIDGLAAGNYAIRQIWPSNSYQSSPGNYLPHYVTVVAGQVMSGRDFGVMTLPGAQAQRAERASISAGVLTAKAWSVAFIDSNRNGIRDAGDQLLTQRRVFEDLNGNGVVDAGERTFTTDHKGRFNPGGASINARKIRVVSL
jgi:SdrD B-like domain